MIKKIAIILGAVLLLAGCDPGTGLLAFFSASSFPAHLGLVEKAVDLKDRIHEPRDKDDCYNCNHLHFLNGYVFLTTHDSRLLIFNENLKFIREEYNDYAYGTMGFTDGATIFLGVFDYSNNPPDFTQNPGLFPQRYGFGFFDGLERYAVSQYDHFLELIKNGLMNQTIDLSITGKEDWRLSSFAYDDTEPTDSVFFFRKNHSDRDMKAVFLNSLDYKTAFNEVAMALENPTSFPEAEDGLYYYTHYYDEGVRKPGFVGVWNGTIRLVDSSGESLSSISGYSTERLAMAFDIEGRFFYLYDADQKALFRCRTWWNK